MTVYVGAVKDNLSTVAGLVALVPDLDRASLEEVGVIDKAVHKIEATDAAIDALDPEIGLALEPWLHPTDGVELIEAELANSDQMVRLLDTRAYAGQIDRALNSIGGERRRQAAGEKGRQEIQGEGGQGARSLSRQSWTI